MMTPNHQISDELLMGYAAGALPQAFDLVVATHVSLNHEAQARLDGYDALGGAVLDELSEVAVHEDSLSIVMSRLDECAQEDTPRTPKHAAGVFPEPLRALVGGDKDAVKWRSVGMGVKQAVLHEDGVATARLLMIPAGCEMPKHSHTGMEMTLVLQGAYSDDDGRFARGDIEVAIDDHGHSPVADKGEDCICLIATDGRLKFEGLLPRIAQRFIGI